MLAAICSGKYSNSLVFICLFVECVVIHKNNKPLQSGHFLIGYWLCAIFRDDDTRDSAVVWPIIVNYVSAVLSKG